jgi:hypothetical protein
MLFHIGTVATLALLTIANVVTWLRPFSTSGGEPSAGSSRGIRIATASDSNRSPAAIATDTPENSKNPLKTAQVGCEPKVRLRVVETVHQLRLQFDSCNDVVTSVMNSTNGFEATVFGTAKSRAEQAERADAVEPAAGTFTAPINATAKSKSRRLASVDPKPEKIARSALPQISTDYISLVVGANQIKILREGREQILNIERK